MRQDFIALTGKFLISTSLLLFLLCSTLSFAHAQSWQWIEQFGTTQSETVDAMQTDNAGHIYLSGKFKDSFDWGTTVLQSIGKDDIYLTKLDALGNVLWAKQGGSEELDESIALAVDEDANIYATGHYWFEANFESVQLQSGPGSRAIFLLKYDEDGNILWGKSINGTATKTVSSLATDAAGNIYVSGSFKGELLLNGTSLTASTQGDIFLAKFDATGQLDWTRQLSASVSMKSVSITVDKDNDVLMAGQFIGSVTFAGDSFENITGDNDVYLLKYSAEGMPIWGRKAGGVHEDDCSQIRSDASGNVYLTGTFIGVMELSAAVQIQTQGFNNNFYILKYDEDGNILWARSLGGTAADGAEDMIINENLLVVAGYFTEAMTIDGISLTANETFGDGFVAAFDLEGQVRSIQTIASEGFVIPNNLSFTVDEEILCSGVFEQTAQFDVDSYDAEGSFDIFLTRIGDGFTGVGSENVLASSFRLFPNPTSGNLYIQTDLSFYRYELYDRLGQLLQKGQNVDRLDLSAYGDGLYFIRLLDQVNNTASFGIGKFRE